MKSRVLLIFTITIFFMCITACDDDLCSNDVVKTVSSPDNSRDAVIFIRACGATTSDSYQLSILEEGEEFSNKKGNIFISQGQFEVNWSNNNKLQVTYSSEVFKQKTQLHDVEVEYIYDKYME